MFLAPLAAALLAQAPLPPGSSQELPPGHPPLTGGGQTAAPPMNPPPGATLPPNHPPVGSGGMGSGGSNHVPTSDELIKKLDGTPGLREQDRPYEVSISIGHLYFGQGRYPDARFFYEAAAKKAEPVRAFYLEQRKALGKAAVPEAAAVGCADATDATQTSLFEKAQAKAKAKETPAAVACARAALRGLDELEAEIGHTYFLAHDTDKALAAYDHALETFDTNHEARYSRAALLLDQKPDDVKSLKVVKAELEKVLADSPTGPHTGQAKRLLERTDAAIAAGGVSKLPLARGPSLPHPAPKAPPARGPMMGGPMMGGPMAGGPMAGGSDTAPNVDPSVMAAMAAAGQSPEAQAKVDGIISTGEEALAKGKYQDALDAFKGGMPIAPNNARLRAGLAWSLIQLGKPTADRVWGVALQDPDAIARLSDTLESKGDAAGAKALRQRLVQAVPAMGARFQGKL